MVEVKKLYRVVRQHVYDEGCRDTVHSSEVLYCGYDRDEARRVYHENTPRDTYRGAGKYYYRTVCQSMRCD